MTIPWKRSILALVLGGVVVWMHWKITVACDDFVTVRPYKSGYAEVYMGNVTPEGKTLVIPMPDGSRDVVSEGQMIGYKVFKYGFPFSYRTSSTQLPMCTPDWQVPIRIALNVTFFAAVAFSILTGFSLMKRRQYEPVA